MGSTSPAKGIAEGNLREGSSLIMVYFTIRAAVPKLVCSLESPRELQKILALCHTSIDCDLISLRYGWGFETFKRSLDASNVLTSLGATGLGKGKRGHSPLSA